MYIAIYVVREKEVKVRGIDTVCGFSLFPYLKGEGFYGGGRRAHQMERTNASPAFFPSFLTSHAGWDVSWYSFGRHPIPGPIRNECLAVALRLNCQG